MKKVSVVMSLIIICYIFFLCTAFTDRQQNPAGVAIATISSLKYEKYPSLSINHEGKININLASINELCLLSNIGPTLAGRIVQYREENGPYKSVNDLLKVRGIGEATLNNIIDYICV